MIKTIKLNQSKLTINDNIALYSIFSQNKLDLNTTIYFVELANKLPFCKCDYPLPASILPILVKGQ